MKKKKAVVLRFQSLLIYASVIAMIILLVVNSRASIDAVKRALVLCYQTIIPSLFPFFVLSGLLIQTGFVRAAGKVLSPMMRPMFRVGGSGALVFVIGIISGYPTGAKMVADLYEKGLISRAEGRRLLPYCNNSGPLFLIGAIGTGMLTSGKIGMFLYLVHITAAILVGLCFRFYGGEAAISVSDELSHAGEKRRSFGEIFSFCVSNAVNSTLLICGFIAMFSSFVECVKPLVDVMVKNPTINLLIEGLFEVTVGVGGVAESNLVFAQKLTLISFLVGFGGVCVHLQVFGMLASSGLGIKTYLVGKCMHALFSAVITLVGVRFFTPQLINAWSPSGAAIAVGVPWRVLMCCALAGGFLAGCFKKYINRV